MRKIKVLILLSFVAIICTGCPGKCEYCHQYITFVNKSDKKIGYQLSFDRILYISQDTIFHCNNTSDSFIYKNSIFALPCPAKEDNWEEELSNSYYIQCLIMDGEIFSKYYTSPCDSISKYVPILHCYRLTLEDLERMNWTVVYPPEE
jgi:hypothetical protein